MRVLRIQSPSPSGASVDWQRVSRGLGACTPPCSALRRVLRDTAVRAWKRRISYGVFVVTAHRGVFLHFLLAGWCQSPEHSRGPSHRVAIGATVSPADQTTCPGAGVVHSSPSPRDDVLSLSSALGPPALPPPKIRPVRPARPVHHRTRLGTRVASVTGSHD
jgi:hypothetical protein